MDSSSFNKMDRKDISVPMSGPIPSKPSEVKEWCISNGFHPNKTLGQNFLIDRNTIEAILDGAGVKEGMKVLEVGPGLGALTHAMLSRGAVVTAVEKDVRLAELLGKTCQERGDAFTLITADMLEVSLDDLLRQNFDIFLSNLPYSVGTRILLELCRHPLAPASCTVMVQKEVADRLAAKAGDDDRGLAGVWVEASYQTELLRTVPPTCFWPKPQIASAVVKLTRLEEPLVSEKARPIFENLTRLAFMHRRKQLGTILKKSGSALGDFSAAQIDSAFANAQIESTRRPETLTCCEWNRLAESFFESDKAR